MLSTEVVIAGIAAAGSVAAGCAAVIKAVYRQMNQRADSTDQRVVNLSVELVDCHKMHSESNERIGKLEGWREGFADGKAAEAAKPVTDVDTA